MKHPFPKGRRAAFTLIELLVVIAIIGILAGIVLALGGLAARKKILAQARAELQNIETAITSYKAKKGFYPPDNTNNAAVNQLFYELRGTVHNADGTFSNLQNPGEPAITLTTISTFFNAAGFVNASPDASEVINYFPALKPSEIKNISNDPNAPVWIFAIPSRGPKDIAVTGQLPVNPVCYVSSNPTNNPNSFDLWVDVLIAGKTNRIGNWSDEPQIIYQP